MWNHFFSNPPIFAPVNFALYDRVTKFRIFEYFFNFVFSSHDTSFTQAVLENPTKTFMCVGRSLAMARGWKHARVDPHVNCFIPRRLHFARMREGTLLQSPSGRGEVEKLENLLVYERDMTAAPRLYITSCHSGPTLFTPANQCA